MELLTATICSEYQKRFKKMKSCGKCTASNFKELGRELRDRCGLDDRTAIDILNGKDVLEILIKHEGEK